MPTKNRRVATYLPKEIDDRFTVFKAERGIEGDSQALITILAEFLEVAQQVTHQVDHQVGSSMKDEVEELNSKVAHLAQQVQDFNQRLDQVVSKAISELKGELLDELSRSKEFPASPPGQLSLLDSQVEDQESERSSQLVSIPSGLTSELPRSDSSVWSEWMTTKEAWEALKPPCTYSAFRKYTPEKMQKLGLQVDLQRKKEGGYKARWLRLPQVSITPEEPENVSESLGELDGELPEL